MIHEELLYYPRLGLRRVTDLGAAWCALHGLPLPVGLNVIRRDLGRPAMGRVCEAVRRSLRHGLDRPAEALARVRRFGRGPAGQCTERFVSLFANADSLRLAADVRAALQVLFAEVVAEGLADRVPALDVVEGRRPTKRRPLPGGTRKESGA
jgi:1,4-dihydroxy-6-naphthoate synthase